MCVCDVLLLQRPNGSVLGGPEEEKFTWNLTGQELISDLARTDVNAALAPGRLCQMLR